MVDARPVDASPVVEDVSHVAPLAPVLAEPVVKVAVQGPVLKSKAEFSAFLASGTKDAIKSITRSGRSSRVHAPHSTTASSTTTSYHWATGRCGPKNHSPAYDDPLAGRRTPAATSVRAKP